jgi:hypothetical protein
MTVTLELSEKQVYGLRSKALMAGLSLEAWLLKIAEQEAESEPHQGTYKSAYGILAKYGPAPSAEEIDENRRDMLRWAPRDT